MKAEQQEGFFLALAPFMGRPFGGSSRLLFHSQTAHRKQRRIIKAPEPHGIKSVRGSLHSLVVCACVLMLGSAFLPFAACVSGRHANSLRSKVRLSSPLSAPARFPPFPLSPAAVSNLQEDDDVSPAPPLGLKEGKECFFNRDVPRNITGERKEVIVAMDKWAEHINNRTVPNGDLSAFQTTHRPGYERQFAMSFPIPRNLALEGKATLQLAMKWDGYEHNWDCPEHELEIIELADDGYLQGRRSAKETGVRFTRVLEDYLRVFEIDVSSLVYGRNMEGHHLHLLFREKTYECLAKFDSIGDEEPPSIVLTVNGDNPVDAKYGKWDNKGPCRVQCKSPENFRCQVRNCTPGQNGGEPCVRELMIQKVHCMEQEEWSPCTCEELQEACAERSTCEDNTEDGAQCKCSGRFFRETLDQQTVCVTFD